MDPIKEILDKNKSFIIYIIVTIILSVLTTQFSLAKGFTYEFSFIVTILLAILYPFYFISKKSTLLKSFLLLAIFPIIQIIAVDNLCSIKNGVYFFILLPVTTLILLYYLLRVLEQNSKKRILLKYFIIIFLSLGLDLYLIYSEPHIFIYNSFWGYFQGSLYDSSIKITDALIYLAIFKLINSSILYLYLEKKSLKQYIILFVLIFFSSYIFIFQEDFGLKSSKEYLQKKLGGVFKTEHFNIYYPGDYSMKKMDILIKEHEFYLKELEKHFKINWTKKIDSYIFKNSSEKKRLMGAGNTLIAKVWQNSIYINYQEFPHQSLKHEISHVILSKFSNRFLDIPMSYGIYPQTGIIEGMAVAVEEKETTLSLQEKMAILKYKKRFPPIEKMVSPTGFWRYSSYYSYQTLGAFIQFLTNRYGVEKVEKLYQVESFKKAFKKDIKTLENEYLIFLDSIKIPKRYIPKTESNFSKRSIFKRVCPHDIRDIKMEIANLFKRGLKKKGEKKIKELIDLEPNNVNYYFYIIKVSRIYNFLDISEKYLKRVENFKLTKSEQLNYLEMKADILWLKNSEKSAQKIYEKLLNKNLSDNLFRGIYIKNRVIQLCINKNICDAKKLVFDYIVKRGRIKSYIVRFANSLDPTYKAGPQLDNSTYGTPPKRGIIIEESIINYLYGRYYYNRDSYEEVIFFLSKVDTLPYPIKIEKYKMLIKTYFLMNKRAKSIEFANRLIRIAQTEGIKDFAKRFIDFNENFPKLK